MRVIFSIVTSVACCLVTTAVVMPVSADDPELQVLEAQDILDRMAKVYADCESYHDSGVVTTVFVSATGNRTVEKQFTTAFVRPDRFRFEYTEKKWAGQALGDIFFRYLVWRNGEAVQTWWDVKPGVEKPPSLGLALAGATGVSGGSAHTVPSLLLPKEVEGWRLTNITQVKRVEDAKLDKVDCFRIEGNGHRADNSMTLWIDQKTFLVRRIDEQNKFDDFRTVDTTIYDPVTDEEIPDKKLEFDPPRQK